MGCRNRLFSSLLRPASDAASWRRPASFFSSTAAENSGFHSFVDGGNGGGQGSSAYRKHLLCRPPPTLQSWSLPPNTCSLIGTVAVAPRRCDSRRVATYTLVDVEQAPMGRGRRAFSPFRILVMMSDELAEVSLKYLKQNDFIYVSGHLSSYEKINEKGKKEIMHKVLAKDLSYVQQNGKFHAPHNPQIIDGDEPAVCLSEEAVREKEHRERLHLWQVFFANPHEWWDNRHQKPYQSCPDFKHKCTNERLSLDPSDPPWVKKQLELYDLGQSGRKQKKMGDAALHLSRFL